MLVCLGEFQEKSRVSINFFAVKKLLGENLVGEAFLGTHFGKNSTSPRCFLDNNSGDSSNNSNTVKEIIMIMLVLRQLQ